MSAQSIGIDTALSRIQQIQSLQQQLLDPTATSATTAAAASTGGTAATASASSASALSAAAAASTSAATSGTSFATLLAAAEAQAGQSGVNSASATSVAGTQSAGVPSAVQAMSSEADALLGKPYVWGGGHSGWGAQSGYDCSGFVSAVLHAGGYLSTPQDTQTLPQAAGIESGPGQYVTIYDRTDAGLGSDHVIIDIGGQFYESGGEAGAWGGGGGVQRIATPSAAYLASFNRQLHPAGL